jgi:N-hydroxyarylamine O-acetyltransferase
MDHETVEAYLRRIGAERPASPSPEALRDLHLRHLRKVPFENLSVWLDEPIVLDEAALTDKIVRRGRGGICYELNGLFAELLRALGFTVSLLAARSITDEGWLTPPFTHLVLLVELEERYLADLGAGSHSWYPLRLDRREPQQDPAGEFRVVDVPGGDVAVLMDGVPRHRAELRPRELADFGPACWWHEHSPQSRFTHGMVCSMTTETGRVTLSGSRLVVTDASGRTETTLPDEQAILAAYRTYFGVELDRLPVGPPTVATV